MVSFLRTTARAVSHPILSLSHPILSIKAPSKRELKLASRIKFTAGLKKTLRSWFSLTDRACFKLELARKLFALKGVSGQHLEGSIEVTKADTAEREITGYGPAFKVKAFYIGEQKFEIDREVLKYDRL